MTNSLWLYGATAFLSIGVAFLAAWAVVRSRNERRRYHQLERDLRAEINRLVDKSWRWQEIGHSLKDLEKDQAERNVTLNKLQTEIKVLQKWHQQSIGGSVSLHEKDYYGTVAGAPGAQPDVVYPYGSYQDSVPPLQGEKWGQSNQAQQTESARGMRQGRSKSTTTSMFTPFDSHVQQSHQLRHLMEKYRQIVESKGGIDAIADLGERVSVVNGEERAHDGQIPPIFGPDSWGEYVRVELEELTVLLPKPLLEIDAKRIEVLALREAYDFIETKPDQEYQVTSVEEPALLQVVIQNNYEIEKKGRLTLAPLGR